MSSKIPSANIMSLIEIITYRLVYEVMIQLRRSFSQRELPKAYPKAIAHWEIQGHCLF